MKAVIQRVSRASVRVGTETTGTIREGLLVLLGVGPGDDEEDAQWMVKKIAQLRLFEDPSGKMNHSLVDIGGSVLLVSQFTLFGDCRKGNRPSFSKAGPPEMASKMVDRVMDLLRERGIHTETGRFGAMMQVALTNEGPVTLILDTDEG